jgi:Flp pilus assembly pilin Flp
MPAYPVLTMREMATRVKRRARSLFRRAFDEAGAVATEYGLTLLLISLAIIVAATGFGIILAQLFSDSAGQVAPIGGS